MSEIFRNGRLKPTEAEAVKFISSIKDDEKLLKHVIEINEAHVIMLMEQRIITKTDGVKILNALENFEVGMKIKPWVEDIHVNVEEEVIRVAGEAGENIHIAKSRNDQVATAIRMKLREELIELMETTLKFQEKILKKAEQKIETVIPSYTHLRPAQPTTFAHYLLSYFDAFQRNLQRLMECYVRVNMCPMGAAALATTSFPISRERVAELLGFAQIVENSLDAVGNRDFVLEALAVLSIMAVDISRLAEDMIIWSTLEFGLIELPDELCSTSSIMPQKKNPDVLEVVRARMSHVIGNFTICTLTLKALPASYNLDFQEITPKLWESIDKIKASLDIMAKLIEKCEPNTAPKNSVLAFSTSTELVNVLVRKYNVPFRTAHKIVGALVRQLIQQKLSLADATPEMLRETAKKTANLTLTISAEDLKTALDYNSFLKSHKVRGGPAPAEVKRMIELRKKLLDSANAKISEMKLNVVSAHKKLRNFIKKYTEENAPWKT
ncbi:MAG: argininosuccinate lyase [Candidatus Bathyarchaeia archaeon]